jgi:hypothetical protein
MKGMYAWDEPSVGQVSLGRISILLVGEYFYLLGKHVPGSSRLACDVIIERNSLYGQVANQARFFTFKTHTYVHQSAPKEQTSTRNSRLTDQNRYNYNYDSTDFPGSARRIPRTYLVAIPELYHIIDTLLCVYVSGGRSQCNACKTLSNCGDFVSRQTRPSTYRHH